MKGPFLVADSLAVQVSSAAVASCAKTNRRTRDATRRLEANLAGLGERLGWEILIGADAIGYIT